MAHPQYTLDAADTAKALGVSEKSMYRLIDAKRFPPGIAIGGRRVWLRKDVEAYLHLAGRIPDGPPATRPAVPAEPEEDGDE